MAEINEKTIESLTRLSRIACSHDEMQKLVKNLNDVLVYMDQLNEVNTDSVTPCNHVLEYITSVMREDIVGEVMPRELLLANAPAHIGGMIRVPPVLKAGS